MLSALVALSQEVCDKKSSTIDEDFFFSLSKDDLQVVEAPDGCFQCPVILISYQ